jgi:hypothetical protein
MTPERDDKLFERVLWPILFRNPVSARVPKFLSRNRVEISDYVRDRLA